MQDRQSHHCESKARLTRVAVAMRRGLTPRSLNNARQLRARHDGATLGRSPQDSRMALVHITHEVLDLTRRRARRVLDRDRHYRRSGEANVLDERTASDHGKRERSEQSEQPAQYSHAAFDIELQEPTRPNGGGYHDRILFHPTRGVV